MFSWVDHILCPQIDEQVMIILNRLASIQIKKKIQQPKKVRCLSILLNLSLKEGLCVG